MANDRLTIVRVLSLSQLPSGVLAAYLEHAGYGSTDPETRRIERENVLVDLDDGCWEPEHGSFYALSDGSVVAVWDDFYYETQFSLYASGAWSRVAAGAPWFRVARAYVIFRRAQARL